MSQENVETVRRIYDGWATGDWNLGRDDLDPTVLFVVPPDFPEWGVFVGPQGIREYLQSLLEQWERLTVDAIDLRAVGDTVLVRVIQRGKGRVSELESEMEFYMLFSFRGGRIIRIETVMHEAEALAAVGLSE